MTALIGLASVTGRIEGCKPISVLLHGPPNSGKTKLLERFRLDTNTHMLFGTSASSWGIRDILEHKVPRGVTCIVAPEFQTWIFRKGAVWESLQGLLLPAMDEGVGVIYNGPDPHDYGGARLGLIAAMPTNSYVRERPAFQTTGLLSRLMVIHWSRTADDILASRLAYNGGDGRELAPVTIDIPPIRPAVSIPESLANICTRFAHATAKDNIHRELDRLIALTKAHAFIHGRTTVAREDWDAIEGYAPIWQTTGPI